MGISKFTIYELMSLSCVNFKWLCCELLVCSQMLNERKAINYSNWVNDNVHILRWVLFLSFWKATWRRFKSALHLWKLVLECRRNNDNRGLWRLLPKDHSRKICRCLDLSLGCANCVPFCRFYLGDTKTHTCWGENLLVTFMTLKQRKA